jgi:single-strand DNA-binding protein
MSNPIVTIVGRVGTEPEPMGENGLRFRVVTSDRSKNEETGTWEDVNTSWWTVKAWRKVAEQAKGTLKKGQEVVIVGKMREDNWTNPTTNEKRTSYEINADTISVTTYSLQLMQSIEDNIPSYKTYSEAMKA